MSNYEIIKAAIEPLLSTMPNAGFAHYTDKRKNGRRYKFYEIKKPTKQFIDALQESLGDSFEVSFLKCKDSQFRARLYSDCLVVKDTYETV